MMSDSSTRTVEACNRKVKISSFHDQYCSHRVCNNQGKYDPEKCANCNMLFQHANCNTNDTISRKVTIAMLLAGMRSSTAFNKPLEWVDLNHRDRWWTPFLVTGNTPFSRVASAIAT